MEPTTVGSILRGSKGWLTALEKKEGTVPSTIVPPTKSTRFGEVKSTRESQ